MRARGILSNFLKCTVYSVLFVVACALMNSASAQIPDHLIPDRYIDPNKGSIEYTKKGIMDGNLVRTIFLNHGEIAHWPDSPSGEWPKGTGQQYVDGIAIIVQAKVPQDHPYNQEGKDIYPLQSNYREFIKKDPITGIPWGWAPLPGYANPNQTEPAMSTKPNTWPRTWPDRASEWDGLWNGYFGRGIHNAQLETYFRMDDAQDKKYKFTPDPDDPDRGGLGMQVAVRGFQWTNVLAQDVIFWHYEITNVGKVHYDEVLYAQYVDWGIGGTDDSHDDLGAWDKEIDIAYAWDLDGVGMQGGVPWSPVGMAGYVFAESPGLLNNQDNDWDGVIDESRTNIAETLIEGRENIISYMEQNYDMERFFRFYGYDDYDDIPAVQQEYWWIEDENANWRGFLDLNGNGIWDEGEPLMDDVGSDGLDVFDEGYIGPTPDGTQGNGRPDQGEPNFGILDPFESDQIGLTGFNIFPVHYYQLINDDQNWEVLSYPTDWTKEHEQLIGVNLAMFFSSGSRRVGNRGGTLFPMPPLHTERFSMALIFGMDRDDLFRRARTVRGIYNAGYRFAEPPWKPTIKIVSGDKKVTLYWDDRAEKSFDRFLREYDFQGYKIYKSTEPQFLENMVITDAHGAPIYRKPVAQFDLKNGITGYHPIDIQGLKYYLGSDTGLRHTYVDTDVQNGQVYYYAVVSYDYGHVEITVLGEMEGIPPSECTAIIDVDISGNVKVDLNTGYAIPGSPASGYVPPQLDGQILHDGPGTGHLDILLIDPEEIKDGNTYRITFENPSHFQNSPEPVYAVVNMTTDEVIVEDRSVTHHEGQTPVVDGMVGYIHNDEAGLNHNETSWVKGNTNLVTSAGLDHRYRVTNIPYPADFEIQFYDEIVDTSAGRLFFGAPAETATKFTIKNLTENKRAYFLFFASDPPNISPGDRIIIVYGDSLGKPPLPGSGNYRTSWMVEFRKDEELDEEVQPPQPGDVYRIKTLKPFRSGESFQFTVKNAYLDLEKAKLDLADIAVVPNPYVGAASWEQQLLFRTGRGERLIYFINLPSECTIRIYTVSGQHVITLYHSSTIENGQRAWNLLTKDGMELAYGNYIYHVEAPGIGEKIGRFAVIK